MSRAATSDPLAAGLVEAVSAGDLTSPRRLLDGSPTRRLPACPSSTGMASAIMCQPNTADATTMAQPCSETVPTAIQPAEVARHGH